MTTYEPPEEKTWKTGYAYQPEVALGNVARWLVQNVVVTGLTRDKLDPEDLMKALERDNPKDEMGHWGGHTKAEVFARARELMPGFPKTTYPGSTTGGTRKNSFLMGVKLTTKSTGKAVAGPAAGKTRDQNTHKRQTQNQATAQYAAQRPARACGICSADISHRHLNAKKCRDCKYQRLPLTEIRRSQRTKRECLDCGTDISLKPHNATRCDDCAPEHKLQKDREYRARPEVRERDRKYRSDPEIREIQNQYQKEYNHEKMSRAVRKVKAETKKLEALQGRGAEE